MAFKACFFEMADGVTITINTLVLAIISTTADFKTASAFASTGLDEAEHRAILAGERTGRLLGSAAFVADLEARLGRVLARRNPGPKRKDEGGAS